MTSTQAVQELPQWVDNVVKITPALVALVVGLLTFGIQYRQYRISFVLIYTLSDLRPSRNFKISLVL